MTSLLPPPHSHEVCFTQLGASGSEVSTTIIVRVVELESHPQRRPGKKDSDHDEHDAENVGCRVLGVDDRPQPEEKCQDSDEHPDGEEKTVVARSSHLGSIAL